VSLSGPSNIGGLEIDNRSFIDDSGRDVTSRDQASQPCRGERIDLVVQRGHSPNPPRSDGGHGSNHFAATGFRIAKARPSQVRRKTRHGSQTAQQHGVQKKQ
jgi:CDGSH-type Zn-finger protein